MSRYVCKTMQVPRCRLSRPLSLSAAPQAPLLMLPQPRCQLYVYAIWLGTTANKSLEVREVTRRHPTAYETHELYVAYGFTQISRLLTAHSHLTWIVVMLLTSLCFVSLQISCVAINRCWTADCRVLNSTTRSMFMKFRGLGLSILFDGLNQYSIWWAGFKGCTMASDQEDIAKLVRLTPRPIPDCRLLQLHWFFDLWQGLCGLFQVWWFWNCSRVGRLPLHLIFCFRACARKVTGMDEGPAGWFGNMLRDAVPRRREWRRSDYRDTQSWRRWTYCKFRIAKILWSFFRRMICWDCSSTDGSPPASVAFDVTAVEKENSNTGACIHPEP